MGKRSDFERIPRDLYQTVDPRAVAALLPHLEPATRYVEPTAGAGRLKDALAAAGHVCVHARDIVPLRDDIELGDAFDIRLAEEDRGVIFIGNTPWSRPTFHGLIQHLSDQAPTWLLHDAGWLFTAQAAPFMAKLRKIIVVGRLRWIEGSAYTSKDDVVWSLFDRPGNELPSFIGRAA